MDLFFAAATKMDVIYFNWLSSAGRWLPDFTCKLGTCTLSYASLFCEEFNFMSTTEDLVLSHTHGCAKTSVKRPYSHIQCGYISRFWSESSSACV